MKENIKRKLHKTKISYSYVMFSNGKTGTNTIFVDSWISNMTTITNRCNKHLDELFGLEKARIYTINSIEHVAVIAHLSQKDFNKYSTIVDGSMVVIRKIR